MIPIKTRNQRTFIYCPKCNNEMVSNGYAIEDNDGIIKYKCSKCENISFWDKDCNPDTQKAFEPKGLSE